ncbi:MAG: hypothetical protein IT214_08055 [Chitinophagaceae bacterium]|nr:hypothetical protein [Chitinophagaceae bacterium]
MKSPVSYQFGVNNRSFNPFDLNEKNAKRLERLLKMKDAELITMICKHYISNFIPDPVKNENEYWIISCFPSTDHSPVRVSIWFPEVFNITPARSYFGHTDDLQCMVFVHKDYFNAAALHKAERKVKGLHFRPGYRFVTGIDKQLAAFMPLRSYFSFAEKENIFESIRTHNYELTLKGRTPFKKGHNYEFVRYLFR